MVKTLIELEKLTRYDYRSEPDTKLSEFGCKVSTYLIKWVDAVNSFT